MASSQTPPDTLSSPDAGAPFAPPHPVPADSRSRWPAALVRLWRSVFGREAFAHPAHGSGSAPGGRQYFPRGGAKPSGKDLPRA